MWGGSRGCQAREAGRGLIHRHASIGQRTPLERAFAGG
jgi:hypothetical protein